MQTPYTLHNTAVHYEDNPVLRRSELSDAVVHALKRKLRVGRYDAEFFRSLERYGEATLTWNFVSKIGRDDQWVTLHAFNDGSGEHRLHCIGPQAESLIDRINEAVFDKTPKWLKKKIKAEERRRSTSSKFRKRKKKAKARVPTPEQTRKPRRQFIRAPISLELNELLTPQFRNKRIFWNEALEMAKYVFAVRDHWKYTARERVARELYASLERSGFRFAQFKRRGFCLRFDLVVGWKGMDMTAITVACTKDNARPEYRRSRSWMRGTVHGLARKTERTRHFMLFEQRIAA